MRVRRITWLALFTASGLGSVVHAILHCDTFALFNAALWLAGCCCMWLD